MHLHKHTQSAPTPTHLVPGQVFHARTAGLPIGLLLLGSSLQPRVVALDAIGRLGHVVEAVQQVRVHGGVCAAASHCCRFCSLTQPHCDHRVGAEQQVRVHGGVCAAASRCCGAQGLCTPASVA